MPISDRDAVLEQYRTAANLDARVRLHEGYSANTYGWHPWVFDQIGPVAGQRILEIGCGPGHLWRKNIDRRPDARITLADLSAGMLAEARRNLGDARQFSFVTEDVQDLPFSFVTADVQDLPFADARFDLIVANHMLYHVPNRPRALAELRRVLRPGGRLAAATNGRGHLRELGELMTRFAPELVAQTATAEGDPNAFNLENGADQLSAFFPSVELRCYDDALVVPDPEPLVAYVLSGAAASALDADRVRALRHVLEAEIAARGAIRIAKESGLFLAE